MAEWRWKLPAKKCLAALSTAMATDLTCVHATKQSYNYKFCKSMYHLHCIAKRKIHYNCTLDAGNINSLCYHKNYATDFVNIAYYLTFIVIIIIVPSYTLAYTWTFKYNWVIMYKYYSWVICHKASCLTPYVVWSVVLHYSYRWLTLGGSMGHWTRIT